MKKPLSRPNSEPRQSSYEAHCERWKEGCGAEICERAKRIVLARGSLPCDVLFIGEAPGESEDVLGRPFVGPAGKLQDRIVREALIRAGYAIAIPVEGGKARGGRGGKDTGTLRLAYTNLVGCIPRDEEGQKAGEPDDESVEACAPRLQEFVRIARPKLIVCVGRVARDWLDLKYHRHIELDGDRTERQIPRVDVIHPAAILRVPVIHREINIQRSIITIAKAIMQYLPERV
jgi:uracil-DNA glycosylase